MKKKLLITTIVVVIIIILFIITIVFNGGIKKESIKIGFIGTLSGSNSQIGIGMRDGFLLEIDEINSEGGINGRQVEVFIRDDESKSAFVKKYDQEFLDLGVVAIFGHELSSKAKPMFDVLKDKEVILMSPTLSTYELSNIDDNFFRTITTNYEQGIALGEYANGKNTKILVTYDVQNEKFAQGVFEGFSDVFEGELGYYSVGKPVDEIENDYMNVYNLGNYDGVLYIMNPNDTMYISQILFRNNAEVNIYSSNWGMAVNQFDNGGKSVEGAVFISLLGELKSEDYFDFEKRFIEKYKKKPEFASVYAYEAASLLFKGIEEARSLSYNDIKESLLLVEKADIIIADYKLNEFGDVKRKTHIGIVVEGKLILED